MGKEKRKDKVREEEGRSEKREEEREEEETVVVKTRCVNPFSSDAFEEFSPVDDSGSFGDSWVTFWMTPVFLRSVCLRCRGVCLLRLMCLIPLLRWLCLVKLCCRALVVRLKSFSLSPESVKRSVWRVKKTCIVMGHQ